MDMQREGMRMTESESIRQLENKIGYCFEDKLLLRQALTHSSYANERKIRKIECNERLEFLGDAILEQTTSIYLFHNYPTMPEGKLSKLRAALVCESALAESARPIQLGNYLFLGKGEDTNGGRNKPSIVSDAMEAVIGAIYLDGGEKPTQDFIMKFILSDVKEREKNFMDHKSALQELVQNRGLGEISYHVIGEYGPEHEKEFLVRLDVNGKQISVGRGRNKKTAEQMAAYEAIQNAHLLMEK